VIDPATRNLWHQNVSWVGATVIPRLDSMKDLWITRNRWTGCYKDEDDLEKDEAMTEENLIAKSLGKKEKSQAYGIGYLKEKIPFQW